MASAWRFVPLALVAACGGERSDSAERSEAAPDAALGFGGRGVEAGAPRAFGPGAAACSAQMLAEPRVATTYYVATDEPGADDACDGRAPTDEGDGHCPWKSLDAPGVGILASGGTGIRLELRTGTYRIGRWEGLHVTGGGTRPEESVVLSAFPGEHPVIDVEIPDGAGCTSPDTPGCVRQVVVVNGRYSVVQGLTIRNGLAYQLEVRGGLDALVRCNRFEETADFPSRSDQMKLDGGARNVVIRDNEFTQWRSQAIDITESFDVLVEHNEFHHPFDPRGGATGAKLTASRITIRDNDVHDLGAERSGQHAFSLGGTGSPGPGGTYLASEVVVEDNRVWNVPGILAQIVSCERCAVSGNRVWNVGGGVLVSDAAVGDSQCTGAPSGCAPSEAPRIEENQFLDLVGDGTPDTLDRFLLVEPGSSTTPMADGNLYCVESGSEGRFGWEGTILGFSDWQATTGLDAASRMLAKSAPDCAP